jgi:hypothetical protein
MAQSQPLSQWTHIVSTHLPHLTRAEANVLASYSFGMVMTRCAGQTQIGRYLAELLQLNEANVHQRLREWCYAAAHKRGAQRQAVRVQDCFAPLLRWVLDCWTPHARQLVFVCDATTLRHSFTVLAVSLVYRGCALPVAWVIVSATAAGSWQDHWLDLLDLLAPAVPAEWQVLVLTDRGLYAKWLFLGTLRATALYVVGTPCRAACHALADRHRPASGTGPESVVWFACLDGMWLQRFQARWLALGTDQDDAA